MYPIYWINAYTSKSKAVEVLRLMQALAHHQRFAVVDLQASKLYKVKTYPPEKDPVGKGYTKVLNREPQVMSAEELLEQLRKLRGSHLLFLTGNPSSDGVVSELRRSATVITLDVYSHAAPSTGQSTSPEDLDGPRSIIKELVHNPSYLL